MYYSATPEFLMFCRKYLGRKVADDFANIFVCDGKPVAQGVRLSRAVLARDPTTFEERSYANCFTHEFESPDGEAFGADWRHLERERPNEHSLTVQVLNGRIVRFFPPVISRCEVVKNETFHSYSYFDSFQLRSPNQEDLKMYAGLLDRCTIQGEEYDRPYVDCPIINDGQWVNDKYQWEGRPEKWTWSWENEFSEPRIAMRRREDEAYRRAFPYKQ